MLAVHSIGLFRITQDLLCIVEIFLKDKRLDRTVRSCTCSIILITQYRYIGSVYIYLSHCILHSRKLKTDCGNTLEIQNTCLGEVERIHIAVFLKVER